MKFIGIGNEQWGPEYPERLEPFIKAIRQSHPEIKIVGGSGPGSEGEQFDYLWPEMKRLKADLVDEHFYRPESWFLSQGRAMTVMTATGRRSLPASMRVMAAERSGTISTLPFWRQPS